MSNGADIIITEQLDRGLSYGESCFETFRVIRGQIFSWDAHWQRLCKGFQAFGIIIGNEEKAVLQACLKLASETAEDSLIRLSVSGGDASWGLLNKNDAPTFYLQALPFKAGTNPASLTAMEYPFALQSKPAKFVSDYSMTLRAIAQLQNEHSDISPNTYLFIKDGNIISGITANIALLHQGKWLTPMGDGILQGVVSTSLIQAGIIKPQPCPASLLDDCDAALLLNSGQFMRKVGHINQRTLNPNHPDIEVIQSFLQSQQGVDIA